MCVIGYPYQPTTQDLWLYEDHTVTFTNPSSGSVATKRPISWNPNSPLYGYRRSLEGISTRLRTFSTSAYSNGLSGVVYEAYNDSSLAINKPVYFNSWPMPYYLVSSKFAIVCMHCLGGSNAARNPASYVAGGWYGLDTYLANAQQFRWMLHDNTFVTRPATAVVAPFTTDASPALQMVSDAALVEFDTPVTGVTPIRFVDARTIAIGTRVWILDSNMKIIAAKIKKCWVVGGVARFLVESVKPDGSAAPSGPFYFLHDSGSVILCEVTAPTNTSDGNGVLGVVPCHMVSAGDFDASYGFASGRPGYGEYTYAVGSIATTLPPFPDPTPRIRQYMADRGYPMLPSAIGARSGSDVAQRQTQAQFSQSMEEFI